MSPKFSLISVQWIAAFVFFSWLVNRICWWYETRPVVPLLISRETQSIPPQLSDACLMIINCILYLCPNNCIRVQEKEHILLTPFERNIDFWRQLWRVIERRYVSCEVIIFYNNCYSYNSIMWFRWSKSIKNTLKILYLKKITLHFRLALCGSFYSLCTVCMGQWFVWKLLLVSRISSLQL